MKRGGLDGQPGFLNEEHTIKFTPFRNLVIKIGSMIEKLFVFAGCYERRKLLNMSIWGRGGHEGKKLKGSSQHEGHKGPRR